MHFIGCNFVTEDEDIVMKILGMIFSTSNWNTKSSIEMKSCSEANIIFKHFKVVHLFMDGVNYLRINST